MDASDAPIGSLLTRSLNYVAKLAEAVDVTPPDREGSLGGRRRVDLLLPLNLDEWFDAAIAAVVDAHCDRPAILDAIQRLKKAVRRLQYEALQMQANDFEPLSKPFYEAYGDLETFKGLDVAAPLEPPPTLTEKMIAQETLHDAARVSLAVIYEMRSFMRSTGIPLMAKCHELIVSRDIINRFLGDDDLVRRLGEANENRVVKVEGYSGNSWAELVRNIVEDWSRTILAQTFEVIDHQPVHFHQMDDASFKRKWPGLAAELSKKQEFSTQELWSELVAEERRLQRVGAELRFVRTSSLDVENAHILHLQQSFAAAAEKFPYLSYLAVTPLAPDADWPRYREVVQLRDGTTEEMSHFGVPGPLWKQFIGTDRCRKLDRGILGDGLEWLMFSDRLWEGAYLIDWHEFLNSDDRSTEALNEFKKPRREAVKRFEQLARQAFGAIPLPDMPTNYPGAPRKADDAHRFLEALLTTRAVKHDNCGLFDTARLGDNLFLFAVGALSELRERRITLPLTTHASARPMPRQPVFTRADGKKIRIIDSETNNPYENEHGDVLDHGGYANEDIVLAEAEVQAINARRGLHGSDGGAENRAFTIKAKSIAMDAASPSSHRDDDGQLWLKVTQAARISGANAGVISRAVDDGKLKGNGESGRNRRINAVDLTRWQLERADRPEPQESDSIVQKKLRNA